MDLQWKKSSRSAGSQACAEIAWRKSSRSANPAQCVEVGPTSNTIYVRDTKDRDGGTLAFDQRAWQSFMASLR